MTVIGQSERATQNRLLRLFSDELNWRYLGDWRDRAGNSNIEEGLLAENLKARGYSDALIARALRTLREAAHHPQHALYDANKAVYSLLRYGVKVKESAADNTEDVNLIDWDNPFANDFALAEEVTLLRGGHERRPDLVLYVNGIAIGVIELKNSRKSIGEGIRQLNSNQKPEFNSWFFSTVQFCFAGSDSEGLKYGTIGTPETWYLNWKEDEADNTGFKLDKYLAKLCDKARIIELMRDFVLFDGGIKKLPRPHQYFGIKAAQEHAVERKGGVIWHTQGSGKSITMVLLARWILANNPAARVAVITDRDELDKQIRDVFTDAGEAIVQAKSGADLLAKLATPSPRLLCSLVHKFGRRDVDDIDAFIRDLDGKPSLTQGDVFVFVDECHRTQSGKLHRLMKAMMPDAVFIGFTGTPLLAKDRATSREVFGDYIHTYKFGEAVEDGIVLDLTYEARDIDQRITSEDKIDQWFDTKTAALNDWQKTELKRRWATLKEVLSSRSRMDQIVSDIIYDFNVKPRLKTKRGNAMLVASSIFEACRYHELFQKTELKGLCAVVTSYDPQAGDISKEDVGANTETEKEYVYRAYMNILKDVVPRPKLSKSKTYEEDAKALFRKEPARMRLLIVVDKLLTGFDAPPCSVLYLDKSMQDHGLFQAICRTNRLDGDDKPFGEIVDYKNLFSKVEKAIAVYTAELDHPDGEPAPEISMKDRLSTAREKLDDVVEAWHALIEPVPPPKGDLDYIHHFCGNSEIPEDLEEKSPLRVTLYKTVSAFGQAFANIADDLTAAGYEANGIDRLKSELANAVRLRDMIRNAAGETLDLKPYEADMRFLIDSYIAAEPSKSITPFADLPLIDLIVKTGIADAINDRLASLAGNEKAIAETIENNVRSTLIREHMNDPAFFERMSALLDEVIELRRSKAIDYQAYLERIAELASQVRAADTAPGLPATMNTQGRRILYNNLNEDEAVVIRIDEALKTRAPADFRGNLAKENAVRGLLYEILKDTEEVERVFGLVRELQEY